MGLIFHANDMEKGNRSSHADIIDQIQTNWNDLNTKLFKKLNKSFSITDNEILKAFIKTIKEEFKEYCQSNECPPIEFSEADSRKFTDKKKKYKKIDYLKELCTLVQNYKDKIKETFPVYENFFDTKFTRIILGVFINSINGIDDDDDLSDIDNELDEAEAAAADDDSDSDDDDGSSGASGGAIIKKTKSKKILRRQNAKTKNKKPLRKRQTKVRNQLRIKTKLRIKK